MRLCCRLGAAAVLFASPGSAQDATGAVALGGGGGGMLDVDGLQNTLQSGGVEGLNKMLKALAAAHGGSGDVSAHMTKDASGNAMYDFRDISGAPKPPTPAQAASPLVSQEAPQATAAVVQQATAQAPPSASSQPEDEPPMPDFGIIEPAKTKRPRLASRSLVSAKAAAKAVTMPPNQDDDEKEVTPAPADQGNHLIVWPPEAPTVAAPQVSVVRTAPALEPPAVPVAQVRQSTSSDEATAAALANGLGSMRQNLDTLLTEARKMLHAHPQLATPAPTAAPASASIGSAGGAAGVEILERLQAIEDENAKIKKEEVAQALRLQAVEAKEQKEGSELKKVGQENIELRDKIKASQSAAFLQDKKAPRGSHMKWEIRTFFHKKDKIRGR